MCKCSPINFHNVLVRSSADYLAQHKTISTHSVCGPGWLVHVRQSHLRTEGPSFCFVEELIHQPWACYPLHDSLLVIVSIRKEYML